MLQRVCCKENKNNPNQIQNAPQQHVQPTRQRTVRNEARLAQRTHKRSLAGVQADVRSQRFGQPEALVAVGALVRPIVAVVAPHVHIPIARLRERLVADLCAKEARVLSV